MEILQKSWWKEAVVYQIYPASFYDSNGDGIGDLRGIAEKLDYLVDLGVDVVWISPYFESPYVDNGYDISDYYKIDKRFGTMDDWDHLLSEMHKRGLKLVMDLVVNHCSSSHFWFQDALQSKDSPYRNFFIWKDRKQNGQVPNNWTSYFGGSAWEYSPITDQCYLHLFSKEQPDLNWENPALRQEIYKMMRFWADKGVDGFRLDVMHADGKEPGLPDGVFQRSASGAPVGIEHFSSIEKTHGYIREMNEQVFSRYDLMTVGETGDVTIQDAIKFTNEASREVNMVFQFDHVDIEPEKDENGICLSRACTYTLKKMLSKWQTGLLGKGWNSLYLSNHDQPRQVSKFGDDKEYWSESAKMLAAVMHLQQGTPFIYQGEEIGMTNLKVNSIQEVNDIMSVGNYYERLYSRKASEEQLLAEINAVGRDNARTPMQWDRSANAGFTTGTPWLKVNPNFQTINVRDSMESPDSIYHFYKKLIKLRHKNPVAVYGDYREYYKDSQELFVFTRRLGHTLLLTAANITGSCAEFRMPEDIHYTHSDLYISNYEGTQTPGDCLLRPYEVQAFLLEETCTGV